MDSKNIGIIGAGVQAKAQLEAISNVRSLRLAKVYSIDKDQCYRFAREMRKNLGIDVQTVDRAEEAVKGSDIVVTATTSKTPVICGDWLEEGTHINAVGSHTPNTRELDGESIKKSKVVVDTIEVTLKEAGDIIIPLSSGVISRNHIYAELGEIVIGRKRGRISSREITLFKYQGLAVQDVLLSYWVYQTAKRHNTGKEIEI